MRRVHDVLVGKGSICHNGTTPIPVLYSIDRWAVTRLVEQPGNPVQEIDVEMVGRGALIVLDNSRLPTGERCELCLENGGKLEVLLECFGAIESGQYAVTFLAPTQLLF